MSLKLALILLYVVFGLLLIAWVPVLGLSVFLLDDPTAGPVLDAIRHYIVVSSYLYPVYICVGLYLCVRSFRADGSVARTVLVSLIPLGSALPWLAVLTMTTTLSLESGFGGHRDSTLDADHYQEICQDMNLGMSDEECRENAAEFIIKMSSSDQAD